MQNNEYCYTVDSKNKKVSVVKLQPDHMNGGFMPKPDGSSYINPSSIELTECETLQLINEGTESEAWEKISYYIGQILYHKTSRSEIIINKVGESPADYPEYTDAAIPDLINAIYYDYSEETSSWVFNISRYRSVVSDQVTSLCVSANYTMFPQYKRDNVYSGSPASDGYPAYLKGDAGKTSIAKLNNVYQQIAETAKTALTTASTKEDIDAVISGIVFPTEVEILAQIQS